MHGERKPLCYNFVLHKDHDGRLYLTVSVTMTLENRYANFGFADGCISADINYDRICLSDISADGILLDRKTIFFSLEGLSSGQISNVIGRFAAKIGDYCQEKKKCYICEDVSAIISKAGGRYRGKNQNRHMHMFAYQKNS